MTDAVIDINDVVYSYGGETDVLGGIDLQVPPGCVCGLVGENGAGKTTLIKMLIGRLVPKRGTVRLFGRDPALDPEGVLGRIGYLSEDRDMPSWMKVGEFIRYMAAFYPEWNPAFAEELRDAFELATSSTIRTLSLPLRKRTKRPPPKATRPNRRKSLRKTNRPKT